MTQLTDDIFAVELPDYVNSSLEIEDDAIFWKDNSCYMGFDCVVIPSGDYKLISLTNCMTEQDAEKITKQELLGSWWNHEKPSYGLKSALESFQSLLKSKGLGIDKNYAIIKNTKQ